MRIFAVVLLGISFPLLLDLPQVKLKDSSEHQEKEETRARPERNRARSRSARPIASLEVQALGVLHVGYC